MSSPTGINKTICGKVRGPKIDTAGLTSAHEYCMKHSSLNMDKCKYSKAMYPYHSQNNTVFHVKYEDEMQVISSVHVI